MHPKLLIRAILVFALLVTTPARAIDCVASPRRASPPPSCPLPPSTLDHGMTEKIINPKAKAVITSTHFCGPVSRAWVAVCAGAVLPSSLWAASSHPASDAADALAIALGVAEIAYASGVARQPRPADLPAYIKAQMYQPDYPDYQ